MTNSISILAASAAAGAEAAAEKSEKELIAVLESDAPHKDKADACRRLGVIGTKDAVPALAALLGDEKLSHLARYGLEPIPDASVDEALRAAAGKLEGLPLVGVVGSLGVRRDAKAVPLLGKLLGNADAKVAATAARSLGKIGTPEAAKLLTAALGKVPAAVRPAVADGCLACAEKCVAEGKRDEAVALYQLVAKAELPKHFRLAATHGLLTARQKGGKR